MYDGIVLIDAIGDHVCFTGVPEAYFKATGIRLTIHSLKNSDEMKQIWKDNPFVTWRAPAKKIFLFPFNYTSKSAYEWNAVYKPFWIYTRMTGSFISPELIRPKLYYKREPVKNRLIISDEAGKSFRRGYPYMNALAAAFRRDGWEVIVLRNTVKQLLETNETLSNHEIKGNYDVAQFTNVEDTIKFMATASAYFGYESGLAHVAGAFNIPYGIFGAANGVENNRHPSCLFAVCACSTPCLSLNCDKPCMARLQNYNDLIVYKFKEARKNDATV